MVQLSKGLSYILRHGASKNGLKLMPGIMIINMIIISTVYKYIMIIPAIFCIMQIFTPALKGRRA